MDDALFRDLCLAAGLPAERAVSDTDLPDLRRGNPFLFYAVVTAFEAQCDLAFPEALIEVVGTLGELGELVDLRRAQGLGREAST